jgi:hypothetical protein
MGMINHHVFSSINTGQIESLPAVEENHPRILLLV